VNGLKNIQVRVKDSIKDKADSLFQKLGTSTNEAIKVFLQMSINKNGFPFEVKVDEPKDLLEWVNSKKLSYSEEKIMDAYMSMSGSYNVDPDFETGVLNETVNLKGFIDSENEDDFDDDEETIAMANIKIIDSNQQDIFDVADADSGDCLAVVEGLEENTDFINDYTNIAILDEFFVFSDKISAKNRLKLFKDYFVPYLKSREVEIVGFLNPGFWRTESNEERKALIEALNDSKIITVGKDKLWNETVNVLHIGEE